MIYQVSETTGRMLDHLVALTLGGIYEPESARPSFWVWPGPAVRYSRTCMDYHRAWYNSGPFLEEAGISSQKKHDGWWLACIYDLNDEPEFGYTISKSRLEAELQMLVISKLGQTVELPYDLNELYKDCT